MKLITLFTPVLFIASTGVVAKWPRHLEHRGLPPPTQKQIPPLPQLGISELEFTTTSATPFDGSKTSIVNATTFDWWYFDAVATDLSASITVVFFTCLSGPLGFDLDLPTVNFIIVTGMFDDGTTFTEIILGGDATIATSGDGSSGSFDLTGSGWTSTPDLSEYTVSLDAPLAGVTGILKLPSAAPAHYPCAANSDTPGTSELLTPSIGWVNAIPDSNSEVNFTIGGKLMSFTGPGYHDKNWGDSLPSHVQSWYWGHGRVGDYSLVWFDFLDPDNNEYVSGYLAKDGAIVGQTCSDIRVRPTGVNSQYPPPNPGIGLGLNANPDSFHIEFNLTDGQVFEADVTQTAIVWEPPVPLGGYTRWIGPITGGFRNGSLWQGAALWDWIRFGHPL